MLRRRWQRRRRHGRLDVVVVVVVVVVVHQPVPVRGVHVDCRVEDAAPAPTVSRVARAHKLLLLLKLLRVAVWVPCGGVAVAACPIGFVSRGVSTRF